MTTTLIEKGCLLDPVSQHQRQRAATDEEEDENSTTIRRSNQHPSQPSASTWKANKSKQ